MRASPKLWRAICLGLALTAVLAGAGLAQEPAPQETAPEQAPISVIKEITYQKIDTADQLQVMIKVEGPFLLEIFELIAPKRMVIDFSPVSRIESQPIIEVNDVGLLSIRTGQFQPTVGRVVFDLGPRVPSHSITTLPDGVKITFWQEVVQPEEEPEVTPQEQPTLKPAAKPVAPELKHSFIARLGPGLTFFLKPSFDAQEDLELYGETASLTETFEQQINPVFDLSLGKFINPKFCAGLGVSLQVLSVLPSLEASLPHPFLFDTYRDVAYVPDDLSSNMWIVSGVEGEEPRQVTKLSSSMWTVYAYGLYSIFQTDKFDLSAGPILGFSFGKLYTLEDFEFTEEAPFESEDVVLTSATFLENKFFKIDPGFLLSGSYSLNESLSAFLTLRMHYVDVMVEELQRRASLFRLNLLLGLQYGF